MKKSQSPLRQRIYRTFCLTAAFALLNATAPYGAFAAVGIPIANTISQKVSQLLKSRAERERHRAVSRVLTLTEQRAMAGKTGTCPYLAGENKWDLNKYGIDLMSGNYSSSVTDMSFDGGYGIPVNVTRSYSSNDGSEEPFGYGWSLSADVRSTAGGLLKSKSAPVRSVPITFKERNSAEVDPNVATQPVAAVTAADASGRDETIQKDVDGILTTPAWDNNVSNPSYGFVTLNGATYQVQTGNVTTTIDGTVYTYAAEGSYPNGTVPYNNPSATPQAANVLKVAQVADRQGNITQYNYNQAVWVTFNKIDGLTQEHPLSSVVMPNGHVIVFTWGNGGNAPTNRSVSVSDGVRTVQYGYTNVGGESMLTSVTTPGGRTTLYQYGNAEIYQGWSGPVATNLLTAITNPQGLTTQMTYQEDDWQVWPYGVEQPAPVCQRVKLPNTVEFYFTTQFPCPIGYNLEDGDWPLPQTWYTWYPTTSCWKELTYSPATNKIEEGGLTVSANGGALTTAEFDTTSIYYVDPADAWTTMQIPGNYNVYSIASQTLLSNEVEIGALPRGFGDVSGQTGFQGNGDGTDVIRDVKTVNSYNFAGNPLSKTTTESTFTSTDLTPSVSRLATVSYAYWDSTKYYQQKATLDQAGRYTYTDYYPNTAAAGSRGQQYQVYDPAHAGFYLNTGVTPPSYAVPGDYWKYQLTPTTGQYSAQFAYDGVGRCTDVYKLQSTTASPWKYVHTATSYGSNGSPTWGQAAQVVEDSGGINRTTNTLAYTSWGKPSEVQDAAGHQFNTAFDLDGNVQTVTRVDSGLDETVASYTYGTSGVANGQPTSITDGLSGVTDSVSYQPSGTGVGQVCQTTETNGTGAYSVSYNFNLTGDRWQTTYSRPNGVTQWEYDDYETVGPTSTSHRVFQTLTKLSAGQLTPEQIRYVYDGSAALTHAIFAQTPAAGFTPTSGNPWYDSTHFASVRAHADYVYDPAGRVLGVTHLWDTWNGSGYTSQAVLENECAYEYSGLNRGLKTSSSFYSGAGANWTLNHSESYSYDPNLDYLTGANYGDGLPNATPSWSYDAAANRTDTVADDLNRPITIGGVASTSDILGNRLTLGSQSYGWDCLNRMISYGTANSYSYRADGMRVAKTAGSTATVYRYDGQMGMEDVDTTSGVSAVTDYGLGARGVDYISKVVSEVTTVGFPLYDAHGNMAACIFRSGSSYSLADQRSYDAWGIIRQGAGTGDPKGRYCANLGHKQDDESGLVYMRARYYEPESGRFISQDVSRKGQNWFAYTPNNPINYSDKDGKDFQLASDFFVLGLGLALFAFEFSLLGGSWAVANFLADLAVVALAASLGECDALYEPVYGYGSSLLLAVLSEAVYKTAVATILQGEQAGEDSLASPAVMGAGVYSLAVVAALASLDAG